MQTLSSVIADYSRWNSFNQPGRNSVTDQLPWLTFAAMDFLNKIIRPDMQVFEYGSGGSTLFWAARIKHIVSIEHDTAWHAKMQKELTGGNIKNITYILAEPADDPDFSKKSAADPDGYVSADSHYKGKNFRAYVQAIDKYPDEHFDVIIVDGRARPSCIKHAFSKLNKNGFLIVDNTDRSYYLQPFNFNRKQWRIWNFAGPGPYIPEFFKTSILQKK